MRKNKFRGKQFFKSHEWFFGSLIQMSSSEDYQIFIFEGHEGASTMSCGQLVSNNMTLVIPETVGQYIGISDTSEKPQELYEDDVVEIILYSHFEPEKIVCKQRRKIEFKDGMFGVQWTRTDFLSLKHHFANNFSIIKIGNIWDNPELVNDDE